MPALSRSYATTNWRTKASHGSPWPSRTKRTGTRSTSGYRATPRPSTRQHPRRPLPQATRPWRSTPLRLAPWRVCSTGASTSSPSRLRRTTSQSGLWHTHTPSPHTRPRRMRPRRTVHKCCCLSPWPSAQGHSHPRPGVWPPPSTIHISHVPWTCGTPLPPDSTSRTWPRPPNCRPPPSTSQPGTSKYPWLIIRSGSPNQILLPMATPTAPFHPAAPGYGQSLLWSPSQYRQTQPLSSPERSVLVPVHCPPACGGGHIQPSSQRPIVVCTFCHGNIRLLQCLHKYGLLHTLPHPDRGRHNAHRQ